MTTKKKKATFRSVATAKAKAAKRKKTTPFRDLFNDGVTYSFLDEFQKCREQARLSYVVGYTQVEMVEAFEYGNCIHACLEAYGKANREPINHNRVLNDYREKRLKSLPASERTEFNRIVETARLVWPAYLSWWTAKKGMETLPDCEFVSLEEDFKFTHILPEGKEIILRGRFDGILRYQNKLWLMENKTKSVVDDRIADYLPHDMQTMMYCHCVQQKYQEPVAGILYNVVRRPGLKYSTKDPSLNNLLQRIAADLQERPEFYFLRWNVYLDTNDIARWVDRVLNPILRNVMLWWDEIKTNPFDPWSIPNRVHHYASPAGLYTQYGRCNYFDIMTKGNDYGFKLRDR